MNPGNPDETNLLLIFPKKLSWFNNNVSRIHQITSVSLHQGAFCGRCARVGPQH